MKALLSLVLLFALTACATKKDEIAVEKKAQETNVSDSKGLGTTIHDLISASKTLTEAQKKELTDIIAANKEKAEKLSAESYRYRSLLIKELLSGKPVNTKQVKIIKKDIQKIEDARLKNTFDTVEKIGKIVSSHPENLQYHDHLIIMEERAIR